MTVYLVGAGPGDPDLLTAAARRVIEGCDLLVGAPRLLQPFQGLSCDKRALVKAGDIAGAIRASGAETAVVLLSGDTGFFSGAAALRGALSGLDVREVPGISSVQCLCAKVGASWDDAHLTSAHGRPCDVAALVRRHGKVALLTGGALRAHDLCRQLAEAGLGDVRVHVGERLSYPDERIASGTAAQLAAGDFADLSVMLVDAGAPPCVRPDDGEVAAREGAAPQAPRVLVAAPSSGAGKTTFACGLMRALVNRGLRVQACKCGPDYIDPLFHRRVVGAASRNLDLFLMDRDVVRGLVAAGAAEADVTVIEGAMGYYDGIAAGDAASAWDVARTTGTPAVLVVDARARALSVAAEVAGFMRFRDPSCIAGVVFNRVSAARFPRLRGAVRAECGLPVLGYLPDLPDCGFQSRHLGLVPADEVAGLQERLDSLARAVEAHVDLDALLSIASSPCRGRAAASPPGRPGRGRPAGRGAEGRRNLPASPRGGGPGSRPAGAAPVIAVARDEAFCFYYDDALRLLQCLGARVVEFSPLRDGTLPEGAAGLYLGGGYPELHAERLAANGPLLGAVRAAVEGGMPTIAECGGFLYLHDELEDDAGRVHALAGAVHARAFRAPGLRRFGYVQLTAREDGLLAPAGATLRAHEFHYWESTDPGAAFLAEKPQDGRTWECAHAGPALYAGFPHLCLHGAPDAAARFVAACGAYARAARA